jgi:hypothetical protein
MEESESIAFNNYMNEVNTALREPEPRKNADFERELDDYVSKGAFNRGGIKSAVRAKMKLLRGSTISRGSRQTRGI